MSARERDYSGPPRRFKTNRISQLLARPRERPVALVEHLLDKAKTLRVLVEPGLKVAMFLLILAAHCAVGLDLGPYRISKPMKTFLCLAASDAEAALHRLGLIAKLMADKGLLDLLNQNLTIYRRDLEDPLPDLGEISTQEAMRMAMDEATDIFIADWVPSLRREKLGRLLPISPYRWFQELNGEGIAVVAFDELAKQKRSQVTEAMEPGLAYLTAEATAPTQLGGGFRISRSRAWDPDYAPKECSFWFTEIGGCLEYGFYLPDDDDASKPTLKRSHENYIKAALMIEAGVEAKDIAERLEVHASSISRLKKKLQEDAKKAAEVASKDPLAPENSWATPAPKLASTGPSLAPKSNVPPIDDAGEAWD